MEKKKIIVGATGASGLPLLIDSFAGQKDFLPSC